MSNSEKRLGAIVLILGVLAVSYFSFSSYTTYLDELRGTESRLQNDADFLKRDKGFAKRDRETLDALAKRSLPTNRSAAATSYKSWLFKLVEKEVRLQNVKIESDPIRTVDTIYDKHSFTLTCDGTLQQ